MEESRLKIISENEEMLSREGNEEGKKRWIDEKAFVKTETYNRLRSNTISTLSQEFAEFKIRLGRVNIDIEILGDQIQFKRFGEIINDMNATPEILIKNPHPEIFQDLRAYRLFLLLHSVFKNSRTPLADYSFVYRQLSKEGKIKDTYKPERFREWISQEPFRIGTDAPFKSYDISKTQLKIDLYNTLKTVQ